MTSKLYYADKNLKENEDIPLIEFKNWRSRLNFITDKVIGLPSEEKVFLLCVNYNKEDESNDDIYVFENFNCINFLNKKEKNYEIMHLHEYESYEDAYRVALNMKEVNKLCYSE